MTISFYISRLIGSLIITFFTATISAQTPSFRWEKGISGTRKFDSKWALNLQILERTRFNEYNSENLSTRSDRMEIRGFLTYSLFNQRKMSLGYMYRSLDPFDSERGFEHRITQQFAFISKLKALRITNRIRLEERIFENEFELRLRYQFSNDFPIQGESLDVGELYLVLGNELVLSLNKTGEELENRFITGIGKLMKNSQKIQIALVSRNSDFISSEKKHILQLETNYFFIW
tara:strand:- start:529 stop:1227 length:699 start_codon:yes stop_codon:yes gene_type:complete